MRFETLGGIKIARDLLSSPEVSTVPVLETARSTLRGIVQVAGDHDRVLNFTRDIRGSSGTDEYEPRAYSGSVLVEAAAA